MVCQYLQRTINLGYYTTCDVEVIEDIFSVKGVDGYMIGPYDLSSSMGVPGEFEGEKFRDAIMRIREVGWKMGLSGGIHVVEPSLDDLRMRISEGFNFLSLARIAKSFTLFPISGREI